MSRQDARDEEDPHDQLEDASERVEPWLLDRELHREPLKPAGPRPGPGSDGEEVRTWSLPEVIERIADAPWRFLAEIWPDIATNVPGTSPRWAAPWGVGALATVVALAALGVTYWPAYVAVSVLVLIMMWVGPDRGSDDSDRSENSKGPEPPDKAATHPRRP